MERGTRASPSPSSPHTMSRRRVVVDTFDVPVAAIAEPTIVIDGDLINQSKLQAKIRAEGELIIVAAEEAKLRAAEHAVLEERRSSIKREAERVDAEWERDNPIESQIRRDKIRSAEEAAARESDRVLGNTVRIVAGAAVGGMVGFFLGGCNL